MDNEPYNVIPFRSHSPSPRSYLRPILDGIADYARECDTSPAGIGATVLLALLEEAPDEAAALEDARTVLEESGLSLSDE
jgi:hypothetical protein